MKTKKKALDEGVVILRTYPADLEEREPEGYALVILNGLHGVSIWDKDVITLAKFLAAEVLP